MQPSWSRQLTASRKEADMMCSGLRRCGGVYNSLETGASEFLRIDPRNNEDQEMIYGFWQDIGIHLQMV